MGAVQYTDFYFKPYALLWAAMCDLTVEDKPLTVSTVSHRMTTEGLSDFGGTEAIAACLEGATAEEASFWAERIVKLRKKRALLAAGETAINMALGDSDPDKDYGKIADLLTLGADSPGNDTLNASGGVDLLMERLDHYQTDPTALTGPAVGWPKYDRSTDGQRPGATTLVYARTSSFKSFFVGNIALRLASHGIPGVMFTTESPQVEVWERLTGIEARINIRDLRFGARRYEGQVEEKWREVRAAAEDVREYPIWVNDKTRPDISFVRGFIREMKRTKGIQWVVVDLVDHIRSSRIKDPLEAQGDVVMSMKEIAKAENVHITMTTHIRKTNFELAKAKLPYHPLEEIKEGSTKFQDVDNCVSLVVAQEREGRWQAMDYEEIVDERDFKGGHTIYTAFTKARHGGLTHMRHAIDLHEGGVMWPER